MRFFITKPALFSNNDVSNVAHAPFCLAHGLMIHPPFIIDEPGRAVYRDEADILLYTGEKSA